MVAATYLVVQATTTMKASSDSLVSITGDVLRTAAGGINTVSTSGSSTTTGGGRRLSSNNGVHPYHRALTANQLKAHAIKSSEYRRRNLLADTSSAYAFYNIQTGDAAVAAETSVSTMWVETLAIVENENAVRLINSICQMKSEGQTPITVNLDFAHIIENCNTGAVDEETGHYLCVREQQTVSVDVSMVMDAPSTVSHGCEPGNKVMIGDVETFTHVLIQFEFVFGSPEEGAVPRLYSLACNAGSDSYDTTHSTAGYCSFDQVVSITAAAPWSQSPEAEAAADVTPADAEAERTVATQQVQCAPRVTCGAGSLATCVVQPNSCLGPMSPDSYAPPPLSTCPARRRLGVAHGDEDIQSVASVLALAGIPQQGAQKLASQVPSSYLLNSKQVTKNTKARAAASVFRTESRARALSLMAESDSIKSVLAGVAPPARGLMRHLQGPAADYSMSAFLNVISQSNTAMESYAQSLYSSGVLQGNATTDPAVLAAAGDILPVLPLTGDIQANGLRACTLVDICFSSPETCIYGPIALWGEHGAFGASTTPFIPCSDDGLNANVCGPDSNSVANLHQGVGLTSTWSGGLFPDEALVTSFSSNYVAGSNKWVGPFAKWGSYVKCETKVASFSAYVASLIALGQIVTADGSASALAEDVGAKAFDAADYASALEGKLDAVFNCYCEMTPTCFLGLDTASPDFFSTATEALSALKGGSVIARAYSLGITIARPASPTGDIDLFYGSLARIIDDMSYVGVENQNIAAALNGAAAPANPVFAWAAPTSTGDRTARLLQALELSFDPASVYSGRANECTDKSANKFAPHGLGSLTWQWAVPCCPDRPTFSPPSPEALAAASAAFASGDSSIDPATLTCVVPDSPTVGQAWAVSEDAASQSFSSSWRVPFADFSYTSLTKFSYSSFSEDAPSIMTCTDTRQMVRNWLWTFASLPFGEDGIALEQIAGLSSPTFNDFASCTSYSFYDEVAPTCLSSTAEYGTNAESAAIGATLATIHTDTKCFFTNGQCTTNY